jgi:hypothetical protein
MKPSMQPSRAALLFHFKAPLPFSGELTCATQSRCVPSDTRPCFKRSPEHQCCTPFGGKSLLCGPIRLPSRGSCPIRARRETLSTGRAMPLCQFR